MKALCDSYGASKIHKKTKGRQLHSKDVFIDAYGKGETAIVQGKAVTKWHKRREREVSEKEVWADEDEDFLFDEDD